MGTAWRLHLSPLQSLLYFTVVNSLIYLDRGVISVPFTQATLTALAEALDLSASRAGALGSIFILGFMVSSPLFAYWAQTCAPEKLMAGGLVIWSAATLTAGLSLNYWMLLMARAATGIGEASFVCLAPPLILDSAPVAKKTVTIIQLWISIFYAAMTMGYALGFIYGHETMTLIGTWRSPFLIEAGVMFPLILIAFFLKVEGNLPADDTNRVSLLSQLTALGGMPVYLLAVGGSAAYAFTVGGLGFWGNSIVQQAYGVSARTAVVSLGTLTVFCGVVATVLGSLYMDRLLAPIEALHLPESTMRVARTEVACRISFYSITSGAIIGTLSACFHRYSTFLSALGLSEFLLFL
jgi:MFS family permease